jgi:carbamoyltransferase
MIILGIHTAHRIYDHDPGAAIVVDGRVIAVCEEERFNRVKTSKGCLPIRAIRQCLNQAQVSINDVDLVVSPGESDPEAELRLRLVLQHYFGGSPKIVLINHQMAHLSSAYYASGYDKSMVISYDGSGDSLSCVLAKGEGGAIHVLETYPASNSLGNFYELITQFLGFEPSEGEYKVMGLAPYGKPGVDLSGFISVTEEGYKYNNTKCYRSELGFSLIEVPFYSDYVQKHLGAPRHVDEPVTQKHKDIAWAAQEKLTEAILALVTRLYRQTGYDSLCLAGGVALNCSANLHISRLPFLKNLFVQPAASDRGLALGCALWGAANNGGIADVGDIFRCGPEYSNEQIESALKLAGFDYQMIEDPSAHAASFLAESKIIGWFQGRSEYGPRALGHRSILGNPKSPEIKEHINSRIKFREEFRPFAPSVVEESACDYFDMKHMGASPHMTIAVNVHPHKAEEIPGVTHVNNTARVQTVSKLEDEKYHRLISEFGRITGTPVVLNTSFNVRGQPIVETPLDALGTFASCGLDILFLGNYMVTKRGDSA